MNINKEVRSKGKTDFKLCFKLIILMFVVFVAAFFLLAYPDKTAVGIENALDLCFCVVIPSLYPFMVLSSFFVESSLCQVLSRFFERLTQFIFDLPGISTSVIILSLVGGFPVGASMTASLYKNRQLSRQVGQRLLLFCIGPGPAFVISAVGVNMLGSKKAGVIIYFSLVLSSLLIGFITRFLFESDNELCSFQPIKKPQLSKALVDAVSKSTMSMLVICGWILIFSALIELLSVFPVSDNLKLALTSFMEVTGGCKAANGVLPIPVIAGIIGWGGLSTHFQLMPFIKTLGLKLKLFWTFRIINGAFSSIICQFLLNFFPIEEDVMIRQSVKLNATKSPSVFVSISMFAMCILFLLGNNYVVKNKKKTNG